MAVQKRAGRSFIRALNYHDVPSAEAEAFEEQVVFYREHFEPVGLEELLLLALDRWPHERPGLILSFDDGLASHARVAAPILERHGFVGWFMVPTGFVDTPVSGQLEYAHHHSIQVRDEPAADGRVAMTWDDIRRIARHHVVGCHTVDHVRFTPDRRPSELERETHVAKRRLEEELGSTVEVFSWVGGEESSYSSAGAAMIRKSGFRVGFMTNSAVFRPGDDLLRIQRTNVESSYDFALLELHLSGFYDLLYRPKRRRVEKLTAAD